MYPFNQSAEYTNTTNILLSGIAANVACLLSLLIHPYMPSVSQTMRDQMNITSLWKLDKFFTCHLKPGHKIGKVTELPIC